MCLVFPKVFVLLLFLNSLIFCPELPGRRFWWSTLTSRLFSACRVHSSRRLYGHGTGVVFASNLPTCSILCHIPASSQYGYKHGAGGCKGFAAFSVHTPCKVMIHINRAGRRVNLPGPSVVITTRHASSCQVVALHLSLLLCSIPLPRLETSNFLFY